MTTPTNIIFTGVAGTGKTHRLQQLANDYTEYLTPIDSQVVLNTLVEPLSWREVICLVFLEQKVQGKELLKVNELVEHEFFQAKASLNNRSSSLENSAWGELQKFSSPHSITVKQAKRASQAYFDKDTTSSWYLLDESLPLLSELQAMLADYLSHPFHHSHASNISHISNANNTKNSNNNKPINTPKKERFALVSFHQSYGYDEFVEGIRPQIDQDTGQMKYAIRQGVFLQLCEQAEQDPSQRYAMLIDEINRANVAQVFGELMSLIEPSKRAGQANAMRVQLAYSGRWFSVPSNVDIFATMNTQDHSLIHLDSAFRRRFQFIEMLPDSRGLGEVVDNEGKPIELAKLLDGLNTRICQTLGEQYQLGQAYFYDLSSIQALLKVMARQVLPQLMTHASHQPQALHEILQLDKVDWLQEMSGAGQFGQAGLPTQYRMHPDIESDDSQFKSVKAFAELY